MKLVKNVNVFKALQLLYFRLLKSQRISSGLCFEIRKLSLESPDLSLDVGLMGDYFESHAFSNFFHKLSYIRCGNSFSYHWHPGLFPPRFIWVKKEIAKLYKKLHKKLPKLSGLSFYSMDEPAISLEHLFQQLVISNVVCINEYFDLKGKSLSFSRIYSFPEGKIYLDLAEGLFYVKLNDL
jgi:hypothetical protein